MDGGDGCTKIRNVLIATEVYFKMVMVTNFMLHTHFITIKNPVNPSQNSNLLSLN
jgi:hypothetical protein